MGVAGVHKTIQKTTPFWHGLVPATSQEAKKPSEPGMPKVKVDSPAQGTEVLQKPLLLNLDIHMELAPQRKQRITKTTLQHHNALRKTGEHIRKLTAGSVETSLSLSHSDLDNSSN